MLRGQPPGLLKRIVRDKVWHLVCPECDGERFSWLDEYFVPKAGEIAIRHNYMGAVAKRPHEQEWRVINGRAKCLGCNAGPYEISPGGWSTGSRHFDPRLIESILQRSEAVDWQKDEKLGLAMRELVLDLVDALGSSRDVSDRLVEGLENLCAEASETEAEDLRSHMVDVLGYDPKFKWFFERTRRHSPFV